jgi:hypothetical protein
MASDARTDRPSDRTAESSGSFFESALLIATTVLAVAFISIVAVLLGVS